MQFLTLAINKIYIHIFVSIIKKAMNYLRTNNLNLVR